MNSETLEDAMSEGYWKLWNPEVQARIDAEIEQNRKADAVLALEDVPEGTEVRVEQLDHAFIFGAHIFNFDQLGTDERNRRYQDLFGTIFNSATIAFYWKQFEMEEGQPRFRGEYRDTAEYWNTVAEPKLEPHWRRPATDPVVEFCERKGIRRHGHTLVWGNARWQMPHWIREKLPAAYRNRLEPIGTSHTDPCAALFKAFSPAQIEAMLPDYTRMLNYTMAQRILDIALHYKGRLQSWDVVNESATDAAAGALVPGDGICKSVYGLMPGDYAYRSLKIAESVFPGSVQLNINDYKLDPCYVEQIQDLVARGCKVDIAGAQMHIFDPQVCLDIADGRSEVRSPASVREAIEQLGTTGRPVHLSEITIVAPNNDERGQRIQAVIARNLYRLWFCLKPMMGITWWNVVDDCGAPGEPGHSGLFTRDMEPKPAFHALNQLIYHEWKTKLTVRTGKDGRVAFRGFRGKYRLTWKGADGQDGERGVDLA